MEAYSVEEFLVVCNVSLLEFLVGEVYKMPGIVGYILYIGRSFFNRVLVEAIVASLVDKLNYRLRYIF